MKWLFNENLLKLKKGKVYWEQGLNFKGNVGDEVIFFNFYKGDGYFNSLYKIESVSSKPFENKKKNRFNIEVGLKEEITYSNDVKELSDYIYSFPRVKNFGSDLWRHFNRKYYRVSDIEFEAITKDEIFVSRTMIGSAINAMPQAHRHAFIKYLIDTNPEYFFGKYSYLDVYQELQKYIDFAIISPSEHLRDGYDTLSSLVGINDASKASFISEKDNGGNNIADQVEIINQQLEVFAISSSIEFSFKIEQQKFEKYFKNAPLPINVK